MQNVLLVISNFTLLDFSKFTVLNPDVVVWASLKDRPAKSVLGASEDRLPMVVANGEGFRSLGQAPEAEMC
jgi:hypothetical protein